jgi:hypothetical protein
MKRKRFLTCAFAALGLLRLLMAWKTARAWPQRPYGPRLESEAALRAEFRSLRTKNTKAVYLAIGLFRARASSVPPAAGTHGEAIVCGPAPSYLSQPPRRLGRG